MLLKLTVAESNVYSNGILVQSKFLTDVIQKLNSENANEVLEVLETLRKILTDPKNIILHIAGSLDNIDDVVTPLNNFFQDKSELKP